jgi:uncharacterized membrane protein
VVILGLVAVTAHRPGARDGAEGPISFAAVQPIIATHCVSCHAAQPSNPDIPEAPKGVAFDTAAEVRAHAAQIMQQTVLSHVMPLGNATGMTEAERAMLGAWVEAGAPVD